VWEYMHDGGTLGVDMVSEATSPGFGEVQVKVRSVWDFSVENVVLDIWYLSPKSLLLQDPPLPVTKIQRIMYSKGVCQKLHAELCFARCALEH
jgi:hypothetical protein